MELLLRVDSINTKVNEAELVVLWTDMFDATESAKFKIVRTEYGFEFELIGGMANTITLTGPKKFVVTKE